MSFKPQKALHLYKDLELKTPKSPDYMYIVTEKLDGWYGYLDFGPEINDQIRSRAGRVIPALTDLSQSIYDSTRQFPKGGRLIFEIYTPHVPFHIQNGIYNKKYEQATMCSLKVHDFIPDDIDIQASMRKTVAEGIVNKMNNPRVEFIEPLGLVKGSELMPLAESIWSEGGEGIIGVRHDSYYSAGKRNADVIKVKKEVQLDLLVTGIYRGEVGSKYEDTLGGLIVINKAGVTNRLSGMSDAQRDDWFNEPSQIVGKVVEVDAMEVLEDGKLREGRFKWVRHDKGKADID